MLKILKIIFCFEDLTSLRLYTNYCTLINGVTMGSSLAPILAEIYLSNFENKNIFIDIPLKKFFYYRYVDDIFMIIPSNISEKVFLNYLNSLDPFLKFTMETETQNKLNFLDVLIRKENNKIITSWYRKPSNTLNFTNWNSFGPKTHKINTVKA